MWQRWLDGLLVVLAAVLCACSDDSTTDPTTTGATGGSGGSGGQGGGSGEALTVQVLTGSSFDWFDWGWVPAQGATVAFDLPSGERIERTSGDDGRVTFEAIDWSLGPAGALTGYLPEHQVESFLGLTPETIEIFKDRHKDEVLTLRLTSPTTSEQAQVSGTATNMSDEGHWLVVSTTIPFGYHANTGPFWSLEVPVGEEFSLIALEFHQMAPSSVSARGAEYVHDHWAELEHEAVSSVTTGVELDLSNALATTEVSGSFAIPQHGLSTFFEQAAGQTLATSVGSRGNGVLGFISKIDVTADGQSFEYDLLYVEPPGVPQLLTGYSMVLGDRQSTLIKPGAPVAGAQPGVLPEPVAVETLVPFGQPLSWEMNDVDRSDQELALNSFLKNQGTGASVWTVRMPPGTTEMSLPDLPSGLEPGEVLGAGALTTRIELCGLCGDYFFPWCTRWAGSETIVLMR